MKIFLRAKKYRHFAFFKLKTFLNVLLQISSFTSTVPKNGSLELAFGRECYPTNL